MGAIRLNCYDTATLIISSNESNALSTEYKEELRDNMLTIPSYSNTLFSLNGEVPYMFLLIKLLKQFNSHT